MSENGSRPDSVGAARKLITFIKENASGQSVRRMTLRMIAIEYRNRHGFQCDESIRKLIRFGKTVEGVSELEFIKAVREILHGEGEPVVYPDDERPELILAPDGSLLWERRPAQESPREKEEETTHTSEPAA